MRTTAWLLLVCLATSGAAAQGPKAAVRLSLVGGEWGGVFTDGDTVRLRLQYTPGTDRPPPILVEALDAQRQGVLKRLVEMPPDGEPLEFEFPPAGRRYVKFILRTPRSTNTLAARSLVVLPPSKGQDRRFGFNASPERAPLVRRLGAYWVRSHIPWCQASEDAPLDWRPTERLMATVTNAGCGLFGISSYSLPWASIYAADDERSMRGFFSVPRPEPWDAYVRGAARQLGGKAAAFEVWNEPNFDHFWRSVPNTWDQRLDDYAALLKRTYRGMKQAAPELKVTTGSIVTLSSTNAHPYFEGLLDRECGEFFDVLNLHYYRARLGPEAEFRNADGETTPARSLESYLRGFRDRLAARGLTQPAWITEMGWPTRRPAWGWGDVEVSEHDQACYLVRSHVLSLAAQVEVILWFQLEGEDFGIMDAEGPKPAMAAYAQLARALQGRPYVGRVGEGQVHAYAFGAPADTVVIAWAVSPKRWTPPAFAVTGAEDMLGQPIEQTVPPLTIGDAPVYLYGTFQRPHS